jgi:hypothetical protein
MNIRSGAYDLCKTVLKSKQRDDIKRLIFEINRDKEGGGHLGYLARQEGLQLLGYLAFEKHREALANLPSLGLIPPLADEARQLFEQTHKQFQVLNHQCLLPITNEVPQCLSAIDPYKKMNYVLPADTPDSQIMSLNAINRMAQLFHRHPAFEVALSTKPLIPKVAEADYVNTVKSLLDTIYKSPTVLSNTAASLPINAPQRVFMRHMIALSCLRDALQNLDQIVFQAIFLDKLPLLSEDNVMHIGAYNSSIVGQNISITFQPDKLFTHPIDPYLIILAKIGYKKLPIDGLFRVERVDFSFSQDLGESFTLGLSEIDDNLNSFSHLLRAF